MIRVLLSMAVAMLVASGALAKDLCLKLSIQFPQSILVLKTGRLGKGSFGPVHGYFALYDAGVFSEFSTLDGQALVSSQGEVALGLFTHEAALPAQGGGHHVLSDFDVINLGCDPSPDDKLNLGDICDGYAFNVEVQTEVVSCKDAPKLP